MATWPCMQFCGGSQNLNSDIMTSCACEATICNSERKITWQHGAWRMAHGMAAPRTPHRCVVVLPCGVWPLLSHACCILHATCNMQLATHSWQLSNRWSTSDRQSESEPQVAVGALVKADQRFPNLSPARPASPQRQATYLRYAIRSTRVGALPSVAFNRCLARALSRVWRYRAARGIARRL